MKMKTTCALIYNRRDRLDNIDSYTFKKLSRDLLKLDLNIIDSIELSKRMCMT